MRIVSGSLRGRKIFAPKNLPVRPTTDQAKESLFNVLHNRYDFDESTVLDLFSGTGNISYEFISRGALKVTAVDANFHCFQFQKKTKKDLDLTNFHPHKGDVFRAIKSISEKYDIIFADPPYQIDNLLDLPDLILGQDLLKEGGCLIIEHGKQTTFEHPNFVEHRTYGGVNFSFFKPN